MRQRDVWHNPGIRAGASHADGFAGGTGLTSASGFFLARDQRLFLVTSRHVFIDPEGQHFPDRITIEVHVNREDMAEAATVSIPLYRKRLSLWRQAVDSAGEIDVALLELDATVLPPEAVYCAFTPQHIAVDEELIEVGAPLRVIGFPLGFHDALHHMPVVRRASLASSYGLRFQGMGYFLTDARTHHGTSGAPVVIRVPGPAAGREGVSCRLLGVRSVQPTVRPWFALLRARRADNSNSARRSCQSYRH